ncbi:MAG: type IX secretion system sortase PorU, partial [Chlorobiales bacterium]|nr:type IX secretion system sortase PorU [Chlorobiales bacterium]
SAGEYFFAKASLAGSLITGEASQFEWAFSPSALSDRLYPDWVELDYYKKFEALGDFLKFNSLVDLAAPTSVEYRITNFTQPPQVWDISDISAIKIVTPKTPSQTSAIIQVQEQPGVFHEYIAFSAQAQFKKPVSATAVENQNLHALASALGAPEYVIIYPTEFKSEVERLLDYRTDVSKLGSFALRGVAVEVEKIYNEFSGGRQDFTAIRDFIKYLYDNAQSPESAPKYVLLFGDGDWDMRHLTGNAYPKIPTYQSDEVLQTVIPVTTADDFFVSVDGDLIPSRMTPDLSIGRLSVRSLAEAKVAVDKIISYETAGAQGTWRNRIALVADDGPNGSRSDGAQFSDDSENTASVLPEYLQPVKIYSAFYKAESVSGGRRRPGAYDEIINQINRGALAVNYIGHGNSYIWAEEQIFNPTTSLPLLTNTDKLTIGITATCDFARYDDPAVQSGAEKMVALPNTGAVAMLSTARSIFVSSGSAYPPLLFRELFKRDMDGQLSRLGTSFARFKLGRGGAADATKFTLLGDPALQFGAGRAVARIDSINGNNLSGSPVQLKALSQVRVAGSVRNVAGEVMTGFNGTVSVEVFDASRKLGADHEGTGTVDRYYDVQNSIIFKGLVDVKNGTFRMNFVVPKDLRYDSTHTGEVLLYAWKANLEERDPTATAAGSATNFFLNGTDTAASRDKDGPIVDLYLNDKSFRSGNITDQSPLFIAQVSDQSGINLTQGTGHAMTLIIDENMQNPVTLNDFFEAKQGNFAEGEVHYRLQNLTTGRHTLRFRVWDNQNNMAEQVIDFMAESSNQLAVGSVFNFPNPFNPSSERTVFIFPHNQSGDDLDVKIKIYTIAGRLIKSLRETVFGAPSQVRIEWDGRDEDGSALANGIYLYKVVVKSLNGKFEAELLQKLAIVR